MQDLLEPTQETLKAPSKRWHNRWRVLVSHSYMSAGEVYSDMDDWPTKEIAEEKAQEELAWDLRFYGRVVEEHLGAFPNTDPEE